MSYHHDALGWDVLDLAQQEIEKQCPESAAYRGLLARADELERTWNPTGVYTWQDMSNVVAATAALAGVASSAAIQFFSGDSLPSSRTRSETPPPPTTPSPNGQLTTRSRGKLQGTRTNRFPLQASRTGCSMTSELQPSCFA